MRTNAFSVKRSAASVLLVASGLSLTACGSTPPPKIGLVNSTPVVEYGQGDYTTATPDGYKLNAADEISVIIYREPDLSVSDIAIGADGMMAFPLIGTIRAEGMSPSDLGQTISDKLRSGGFLRNPSVAVNVVKYSSHLVTVEGSVEKPGVYPFKPGSKLSAAVSLASGPNRVAKLDQIALFREFPDGMKVAKFDYAAVRQGLMMDPVLAPGDRIVIGTSGLSQFWQDVLKAVPVFAIFANQL
ncbi:polysaccharide export protein [Novosphingobium sp. SL115]|uniref:polysaccharide biosynthesis/export family protein n=1 Tax=Novosphingobium sp. SL115 TaxID=2995150 RepID=UPI002274F29B|nr:polysaccharide biosynthesis/export family protein [Novosphingobium sp. SL115]MCY1670485.1 polysaccharide export protein [Novosphingobium sp. SL115]